MSRHSMYATLLVALFVGAGPALAQEARIDARFGESRPVLLAILDSARVSGIPTEPLVQLALRGASSGAEPARIVGAVRARAEHMRTAREALGDSATEAEIVSGASAIRSGVDVGTIQRLRRTRPRSEEVAMPLIVLTDIIERGVAPDTAERVILSLGEARSTDAEFQALRQSILTDIRSGAAPSTAAMTRARGVLAARGLRFPDL